MAATRVLLFGQEDALKSAWVKTFKAHLQKASLSFAECSQPQAISQFRDCAFAIFVSADSLPLPANRWKAEFLKHKIMPQFAILTDRALPPPFAHEFRPAQTIKQGDKFDGLIQLMTIARAAPAMPPKPVAQPMTATIPAEDSVNEFALEVNDVGGATQIQSPVGATRVQSPEAMTGLSLSLDSASIIQQSAEIDDLPLPDGTQRIDLGHIAVDVPFETQPVADDIFSQDVFAMVGDLGTGVTTASPPPLPELGGDRTVVQSSKSAPAPLTASPSSLDELGDLLSADGFAEKETPKEVSRVTGRPLPKRAPPIPMPPPKPSAGPMGGDATRVQGNDLSISQAVPTNFDEMPPTRGEITNFARLAGNMDASVPGEMIYASSDNVPIDDSRPELYEQDLPDMGAFEGPNDMGENTLARAIGELEASEAPVEMPAEVVEQDFDADPVSGLPEIEPDPDPITNSEHQEASSIEMPAKMAPPMPRPMKQREATESRLRPAADDFSRSAFVPDEVYDPGEEKALGSSGLDVFEVAPGSESETLKRYAALKERELREKESRIEVLNRQVVQSKERYEKSELERRRLTLRLEEILAEKRNLMDLKDQHQHHVSKLESGQQENLRSLQLRLDNAQFQASKAEKKLLDFKERVRSDIMKIRLRERELANKLELQKRDAEALLGAKDERLLAQKREIDRLEFEIETLKEKMIDETRRAEERASKLTRALQSLKMAQGMLSGIEEEVLPGSSDKNRNDDSGGEAA